MSGRAELRTVESAAETASRWFALRRRHASSREEQEFRSWLESDPAHRLAYEDVTRSWEIAAQAAGDPQVVTMRSEALMLRPERPREHHRLWGALATAAMLMLVFGGVYVADPGFLGRAVQSSDRDHIVLRTGIGQRATATLEDGSLVTLNTNSVLEINYTRAHRDVRLVAGQVLFKVAHDTTRPFIVAASNRQIVAVGTQFEVRLDGQKVRVALLEGKVRVEPLSSRSRGGQKTLEIPGSTAVLEPGEQLLATAAGDVVIKPANVEELVSWQSGRVRFENTSLADAVAEMNRYSRTQIVIADPDIAKIRISGAFRTGQSQSFADVISEAFPVEADVAPGSIRLRKDS